jgi:hypothetical protein
LHRYVGKFRRRTDSCIGKVAPRATVRMRPFGRIGGAFTGGTDPNDGPIHRPEYSPRCTHLSRADRLRPDTTGIVAIRPML